MNAVRVERDDLGSVEIPAGALYGINTARALENLRFSRHTLGTYPTAVEALANVKAAAAAANRAAGVLDERIAAAIDAAAGSATRHLDAFPVDLLGGGGSIGVNMNVNEVLANLANRELGSPLGAYEPVHPLQHVNASQSTADVCHTAMRLAILRAAEPLSAALDAMAQTLDAKVAAFAGLPTLARTCLQDAMPTTVDVLFAGHASLVRRRTAAVRRALEPLHAVAIGGTVIGTGEGAPPAYREQIVALLAERCGRRLSACASPADALQNSDDLAALSAQLALLGDAQLKIAQDIRLLASGPAGGFGEVRLPPVQAGSSFFAGKVNPVVAESVIQCAVQVRACDHAVQSAAVRAELHLNVFDGLAAANAMDAVAMLTAAIERFDRRCLRDLQIDDARCRELASFGVPQRDGASPRKGGSKLPHST